MKKLLLSAMLCIAAFPAFSQAICLDVKNETPCPVYFMIVGDEIQPCNCGNTYSSSIYSLPPYGTISFFNSLSLGGTFPTNNIKSINAAYVFNNPACLSTVVIVGEATTLCPPYPSVAVYPGLNTDCKTCQDIKVEWVSDPIPCNAICANLRFY